MKINLYTEIVLTVIAACLLLLVLNTYNIVNPAHAADVVDVRIKEIDPSVMRSFRSRLEDLPVKIEQRTDIWGSQRTVPVKIENWREMPRR